MTSLLITLKRWYLKLMFAIIGRGLSAGSQIDKEFQREVQGLPKDLVIQMMVNPNGPTFSVRVNADANGRHTLGLAKGFRGKPDLCIRFKHMEHAFLVMSFQEGTAIAFANDRMYVDGEIGYALRLVRCLNQMEVLILPKFIAQRAVKRYPNISFGQKIAGGSRLYGRMALNLFKGA